jgi:hypothetical protein
MSIFSSLKQWNDECNERGKIIEQQEAEKRRLKWKKELEEFVDGNPQGSINSSNLIEFFSTADIDKILKHNAPKITAMIGELYLRQEETMRLHELEGRYEELKERYDELKKEYDKQNELIAEIAKKSALAR